jgi:hypothetical protein
MMLKLDEYLLLSDPTQVYKLTNKEEWSHTPNRPVFPVDESSIDERMLVRRIKQR